MGLWVFILNKTILNELLILDISDKLLAWKLIIFYGGHMILGIDIDDTITKTTEQTDIFAKEYTEKVLNREFSINLDTYDPMWVQAAYGWTKEDEKGFWNLYYEKDMDMVKPKENAIEVINELYKNHEIILITARWDYESGIIKKITEDWLERHDVHYHKLFINHVDKRKISMENNIDLFIDDSLKTCREIESIGIKTLLMTSRRTDKIDVGSIIKVNSWDEILQKINNKEV